MNKKSPQVQWFLHHCLRRFLVGAGFIRSAFFQLLELVVPGASFAEDFGVRFYFRAAGGTLGLEDDAFAFEFEIVGFVFVIGVFDEKIQAAADGTLHRFAPF